MIDKLNKLHQNGFFYWQNPFALCAYCLLISSALWMILRHTPTAYAWIVAVVIAVWIFTGFVTIICLSILALSLLKRTKD